MLTFLMRKAHVDTHYPNGTLLRFAAALALASLGCVITDTERPARDPFDQDPSLEGRDGEGIDEPSDPDFRGFFELTLSGDESTTLTSDDLGESTFFYVDEDPLGGPPHCLITLADRTPDVAGLQGYVLLQLFDSGCPGAGTFSLAPLERARTGRGELALKKIAVDVQSEGVIRETSYRDATGQVSFEELASGRLRGRIEATATRREGDPSDGPADLDVRGDFVAVPR